MSYSLTTRTTLGLIPLCVGIMLRHYYYKLVKDKTKAPFTVPLCREELMYDEALNITRNFMDAATGHTVEEMQKFAQIHTPIPPSAHVVRVSVPLSSCADAARLLIDVFGGEAEAKRVLGGVRWWQVRANDKGIDAEWLMEKKDWRQSMRKGSAATANPAGSSNATSAANPTDNPSSPTGAGVDGADDANTYQPEMDEMRCLLWAHGGGYYFGSVDQERYMIQRYARKIRGRVLAPNYRLAPQYPFPCALQDFLASYLFLIQPPEGAAHRPVKPSNIVIGGDSAGGGLTLALLQVIRDAGLPQPAGAVLVSPWCDLHHSFPSIFLNTDTDVVPATGLTIFKPSPLWPPPPDDVYLKVHDQLRGSVRSVVQPKPLSEAEESATHAEQPEIQPRFELEAGTTSSGKLDQTLRVKAQNGDHLTISRQIQLYTTNTLLKHPLVSPVLAYLGGLPPLFIIASDREVLRDEIIYTAHRAANPAKYPVSEETKRLYPALAAERSMKPTTVHLQVYDDTAHVLPLAFIATTPAKYCYRAIATFIKHVTNMPPTASLQRHEAPPVLLSLGITPEEIVTSPIASSLISGDRLAASSQVEQRSPSRSKGFSRVTSSFRRGSSQFSKSSRGHSDFDNAENGSAIEDVLAGDPIVYHDRWSTGYQGMIRERVSINGIIRPLEGEQDLPALKITSELLGTVSESWIHRYVARTEHHEKKFAARIKRVAKHRERTIADLLRQGPSQPHASEAKTAAAPERNLAWALEADERPPPSSLVARPDVAEARALTRGAKRGRRGGGRDGVLPEKEQGLETKGGARVGTFWKRHGGSRPDAAPPQPVATAVV